MQRRMRLMPLAALCFLSGSSAWAERGPSYRDDVLIADGVTLALGATAIAAQESELAPYLAGLALASYFITPPIVHMRHDRDARAALSLGIRLGMPVLLGAGGLVFGGGGGRHTYSGLAGGVIGLAVGAIAAMVIDDLLLSTREEAAPQPVLLRLGFAF